MSKTADRLARLRVLLLTPPAKIIGVLLVIYAICGFLLAPWLVRQQLPGLVDKYLGAQGSVGSVYINPFLMIFDARDLSIAEKNGAPVLQASRVLVNFELGSLLRWAWTFSEIRIEKPVLNAELDAKENLNLVRVLAPKNAEPETSQKEPSSPPRLLLQHVAITGGVFRFTDHTLQPAARTQISPFNFEMQDISTLPKRSGEHALTARFPDGGSLQWQGKLGLSPLDSSGSITLKDAKLATLWQFVRDHLTITEPAGSYELGLHYRLRYGKGALDAQVDDLAFRIKDILLAKQDGAVLARLTGIAFEGGSFDLQKRSVTFRQIGIGEGTINMGLDQDGAPDWGGLVRSTAKTGTPPADAAVAAKAAWQLSMPKVGIGPLALSIDDRSRVVPLRMNIGRAEAGFALEAAIGAQTQLAMTGGSITLRELQAISSDQAEAPLTLASAELEGGGFDLQKRVIRADRIRLTGGRTWAMRDAEGQIHLVRMFAPLKDSPTEKTGYSTVVDRIELSDYTVTLNDQGFQPPLAYDLEQIKLGAGPLVIPPQKPLALDLSLRVKQGGSLRAKGSIDLKQQSGDLRLELADLALAPLNTLLKRDTTLMLGSGKAGAAGRIIVNGKSSPLALQYQGNAGISDLDLRIENSTERLLSWQGLQVTGINLDTGKNQLGVEQVSLGRPYAKLVIAKDRSTNFGTILRPKPAAAAKPAPAATESAAPLAVNVERVSVERGELDFADLSLVLPFATNVKSLSGSVNGLSSAQESRASLKFEGRVEDYGLARAEGAVQAFAPKKFTDIAVAFRNVELLPLSPYTATFAGRKIASGRLSLDLQYKINNSQLAGDNKVLLEKFTLGEKVESPDAVNLPLDLAIAILTDSDGKIDLAVPVSGNVDSPQFSYGGVIWQAIRTVLTRIVTAPFRALGSLFGADAETLGDIVFDPGSARILPTEYDKIRRVAEGLKKREQLRLVVQGYYHVQNDGLGLRTIAVRADLANREGLKLAPGEDPGPIGFDSAKIQRALENMLNERSGGDAAAQFAAAFQKTAGREAPRVNAALALMGRGAGDRDLYIAMHKKLIELQPLPPTALEDLAKARAAAITNGFINRLKFDPARLGGKPPAATEETNKNGVPIKLSFEPIAK